MQKKSWIICTGELASGTLAVAHHLLKFCYLTGDFTSEHECCLTLYFFQSL